MTIDPASNPAADAPAVAVRPLLPADLPALVQLNRASVPAVNDIDEGEMAHLVERAALAVAVVESGHPDAVLGFVIALGPGLDYRSENYRWFSERGRDGGAFLYVDRIVVADGQRDRGLGAVLYEAVFARAVAMGATEVDCEVNVEPPNPGSLRFHHRLGFAEVGRQETKGGSVVVALLARPVAR